MLVEERDERGAKALVRRVDQLLARVLVPHDGDGLADQGDDVRAARQREAGGAPQEAQRGARFTGELARARKGQELGGAEVVDGHQVWIVILRDWKQKRSRGGERERKRRGEPTCVSARRTTSEGKRKREIDAKGTLRSNVSASGVLPSQ